MTQEQLEALLQSSDAPELFQPRGFDFGAETARSTAFARKLEEMMGVKAAIRNPELSQDGSLFTVVSLVDRVSAGNVADVPISSFGHLATVEGCDSSRLAEIVRVLSSFAYTYVPARLLHLEYSGSLSAFRGSSWYYRYFAPFYLHEYQSPPEVSVIWREGLSFDTGRAFQRPAHISYDSQSAAGPLDALLAAIGTSASAHLLTLLDEKRTPVQSLEVQIAALRTAIEPHRLTVVALQFTIQAAGAARSLVEEAIEQAVNQRSCVRASLGEVAITWSLRLRN